MSSFFRLEPQSFYGVIEKYAVRELVDRPGEYDVVVHYEAALSTDWIAKYGVRKSRPCLFGRENSRC